MSTHDALYTPPGGRGFSADDLQREQLKQIDKIFEEQLPALVEYGTAVYVEEIRQEERMKALQVKIRESLSPEHSVRANETLRRRAEEVLKAEAAAAKLAPVTESTAAPVVAAETRIQAEKRQQRR